MARPAPRWLIPLALLSTGCLPLPQRPEDVPLAPPVPTRVELTAARPGSVNVVPAVPRTEGEYFAPKEQLSELLTTAPPPAASVHARAGWLMLEHRTALVPLARLARPQVQLAALNVDEETFSSPSETRITRLELVSLASLGEGNTPKKVTIVPPPGTELSTPLLSPDGAYLSAVALGLDSSRLGIYSIEDERWALGEGPIQLAFPKPCEWTKQGKLFCTFVPQGERYEPTPAYGPSILEHFGGPIRVRMRSDLLTGGNDEARFDFFFASELRVIDPAGVFVRDSAPDELGASLATASRGVAPEQSPLSTTSPEKKASGEEAVTVQEDGDGARILESKEVGPSGIISHFSVSPDGNYVHVTTLKRPYSHMTGSEFFPRSETLWDVGAKRAILQLLLRKGSELTFLGPALGRRETRWHPFEPATMTWIERSEKGSTPTERWLAQAMPPHRHPVRTFKTAPRIVDRGFTTKGTPWAVIPGSAYGALQDAHPDLPAGVQCDLQKCPFPDALRSAEPDGLPLEHEGALLLSSERTTVGGRPTLESFDLKSGQKTTLFKSAPQHFERVMWVVDDNTWLTERETASVAPHYLVHQRGSTAKLLTEPMNPYPALAEVERRLVRYLRDDGVELSAHLYLPPGYRAGRRLPTVVWIYPTEFTEQSYASYSIEATRHRFVPVSGPSRLALVLAGYALLDNPTMPIIGADGQANDNYLTHLQLSAEAAVRFLIQEGISTPGRIAVGGRSYGAFSALNLLAHTDLFATAIAISGAYNRTLTPFGYQNERRSFWTQTDLYTRVSPFFSASSIDEPILLIHGKNDENPGTPLMQSERMFHAVVGIGGQARLVVLPLEGHQIRGRESVLHTTYEMVSWLDRHLAVAPQKAANPGPRTQPKR